MNPTRIAYSRIGARPGREKYPVGMPGVVVGVASGNLVCRYENAASWVLDLHKHTLLVYSRVPTPGLILSNLSYGYVGSMEVTHKSDHIWSPYYELH